MTPLACLRSHGLRALLRRFHADERGVSAVEFAMLLPLMMTLYLGGVEVTQAVAVDRKVSMVTRAVGDLVAQGATISDTEMTNILNAAVAVLAPYPSANLKVVVSSVKIDASKNATIVWSETLNGTKRPTGQSVTLPSGLAVANTTLIFAEASYAYQPVIGYMITGTMNLTDRIYMRPRLQDAVCRNTTC